MHKLPHKLNRRVLSAFTVLCAVTASAAPLTLETFESAGLDRREVDQSFPASRTADAVHRSLLLRFPGAAAAIAERLEQGETVSKAEIVFTYEDIEISPDGYDVRGQLKDALTKDPPRWHYIAWPLRRPWSIAEGIPAPTYNAWLTGAGFWAKYGAQDETEDRYPDPLGTMELSLESPEGRLDVTALLAEPIYGVDLGQRLCAFEEQGVLLRKWETYDVKYAEWSAYEWAVPSGGNGLSFKTARLEVQFTTGKADIIKLPQARDLKALAAKLVQENSGGHPTAVLPDAAAIKAMAEKLAFRKPEWMPEWQWQRVQELLRIGGGCEYADAFESGDPAKYARQIRSILAVPPRYWLGWSVQEQLMLLWQYGEALPSYVRDHLKDYWRAWLYPNLPNEAITIDPQGDKKFAWYKETHDWQGLFSFFRVRWTQDVGTMNFNHTAAMGALLGGELIGSQYAIDDGRSGLEKMPLRFWTFLDGTSQEMLDHYYFSITLSVQKVFADYGPTYIDRLMGEIIRDRSVELLISAYHPYLRRLIGASGRTRMSNVLGFEQEGGYSVLHTLSPSGVLYHADQSDDSKQRGMYLYGYDFPPARVAQQTRQAPWAPEWTKDQIDGKPLPYEETCTETTRGNFTNPSLWRRAYLGRHYGLASQDIKGGTVDVIGQWYGGDDKATDADQLGTLTVRYNINSPRLAKTDGGMMPYSGGTLTFQHRNKAIVCTKPRTEKDRTLEIAGKDGVKALYSTAALWNFREPKDWKVYVDGKEQAEFPVRLKSGQRITIQDGNAYVALIPLPATDLGRNAEVLIELGQPEPLGDRYKHKETVTPALMINSYNLRQSSPLAVDDPKWDKICRESYGGFIVELGDSKEHGSFAAFQKHISSTKLDTRWDADKRILNIIYTSGTDIMEMGFCTDYAQSEVHFAVEPGQHTKAIPYRRINGKDPYLSAGIDRDTTLTQQGKTGHLEKNGAVLEMEPGRTGYLITEPISGTYVGYNPLPDLTSWTFSVTGGVQIHADGKLGLARITVCPKTGTLHIDHAYKAEQRKEPGIARRLLVFGMKAAPVVTLNGTPMAQPPLEIQVDDRTAFAIPLE